MSDSFIVHKRARAFYAGSGLVQRQEMKLNSAPDAHFSKRDSGCMPIALPTMPIALSMCGRL